MIESPNLLLGKYNLCQKCAKYNAAYKLENINYKWIKINNLKINIWIKNLC